MISESTVRHQHTRQGCGLLHHAGDFSGDDRIAASPPKIRQRSQSGRQTHQYGKTEAIDDVRTGTHEMLDLGNIVVRVYGDAAVTTMDQTEKSRHGGQDFSGKYLFTDVWVKQGGQWRAVSSHGSRIR